MERNIKILVNNYRIDYNKNRINILFFYIILILESVIFLKELIQYIILGIIQGITEPLPISSSGHLLVFRNLLNSNMFSDLNFEIIVNFGSFIAILIIFWKDIVNLIKGFFNYIFNKKEDKKTKDINKRLFKYCWLIVIGTTPVGIAGILLKDSIENSLSTTWFVGIAFLLTAIMLFLVRNINGQKKDYEITYKDAIIIGLIQILALFPGISRSGTVLVGCLICGLNKESALKYTFMLYLPISIATFGLSITEVIQAGTLSTIWLPYLSGLIAAGIVTYFSYKWLSNLVKQGKLWKFSIYCLCLALFVLFYFR